MRATLLTTLPLAALLLGSPSASAQPIPWNELEGAAKLSASRRQVAESALRSIRGYHRCTAVLAQCLTVQPRDKVAWRVARYVVLLAGKGLRADDVGRVIEKRRQSVVPAKQHAISPRLSPHLGDRRAPVTVVEYADFQCPHCAEVLPVLERVVQRMKGRVVLYFKPYPLQTTPGRLLAARAALAAHRQGKFWEMARLLFQSQDRHTPAGVEHLASSLGLDLDRFRAVLGDMTLLREIEANKIEGLRFGVTGTPAFYVNGKQYLLPRDELHFTDRLEEELELGDAASSAQQ